MSINGSKQNNKVYVYVCIIKHWDELNHSDAKVIQT